MTDRTCKECKYFNEPAESYTCGTCEYPIPKWIIQSVSSGNFISTYGTEAVGCRLYELRWKPGDKSE